MAINKLPDARDLDLLRTRMSTQFQIPSAYDDALSYQGLVYKLIQYLKDTMQNVEDWNVWLEDFVNTFDERLGDTVRDTVQQFIDDGSIQLIISEALQWEFDDYKTTNEQDKLELTTKIEQLGINVKDFGAMGDGVTDDTASIQSAIDYASENMLKTVIFPTGQYVVSHIDFLTKKYSGITLKGIEALLVHKLGTTPRNNGGVGQVDGILNFDSLSNSINDGNTPVNSIRDITIENLNFYSDIATEGFNELLHHIAAHGVDNFKVINCRFYGFLGDAISINRGVSHDPVLGSAYNSNVTIRDCYFDGVNNDNRQAISIYHCDSFVIDNNIIKNTCRTNMPGAIDVEPDGDSVIVRSGVITNNKIDNCGGFFGGICLVLKTNAGNNTKFVIANNRITNVSRFGIAILAMDYETGAKNIDSAISVYDNYIKDCNETIKIHKVNGVHLYDNYFENIATPADDHFLNVNNLIIENNIFKNLLSTVGLSITDCDNSTIRNNYFYNPKVKALTILRGVFELTSNKFLTTDGGSGKISYELTQYLLEDSGDFTLENNTADAGYVAPKPKEYFLAPGGDASYSSLPQKFPIGTTIFKVTTGDHPIPDYDGSRTGVITTIRESYAGWGVIQIYVTVDDRDSIFFRRSINNNTWSFWRTFNTSWAGYTATRPPASQVLTGTPYFDLNLQKPVYSNGINWLDANGQIV